MLTRALRERSTVGIILVRDAAIGLTVLLGWKWAQTITHQTAGTARTGSTGEKSALAIDLARQAQPHTQDNCYRFAGIA